MKYLPNLTYSKAKEEYIPDVKPIENWQSGVKDFYKNNGKQKIEKDSQVFAEVMAGFMGKQEIQLRWDKARGLDGINLNSQQDVILNENNDWQEHNISTKNSILATSILINYYKELSKYVANL